MDFYVGLLSVIATGALVLPTAFTIGCRVAEIVSNWFDGVKR
jgi:hypothetical protein